MSRTLRPLFLLLLLVTLGVTLSGCAELPPEQKIAKIRSSYEVQLNSWTPVAAPAAEGEAMEAEVGAGEGEAGEAVAVAAAEGEEAAAEGEEAAAEGELSEPGPTPVSIQVDLVVHLRGRDSLPGLTVDITQADAAQQEKAVYRQWVDTSNVLKGSPGQAAFVLEDVVLEEGDVFAASIAPGVPADLSAYREFSEPAP